MTQVWRLRGAVYMNANEITYKRLGKSDLFLSPIGLGTWQFSRGNGFGSRFWGDISKQQIEDIILASINGGINWLDTAEAYGNGQSEQTISACLKSLADKQHISTDIWIADKWWPLMRSAASITKTISLRRTYLGGRVIDLYQIHHPTSISSLKRQMQEMAKLISSADIRYVGVSNFSAKQMRKAYNCLKEEGYDLVSNQVRYNLYDRTIEQNGILDMAKELGVSIIAYSPLHQGLLTGKFHNHPELLKNLFWLRKSQYSLTENTVKKTEELMAFLRNIAIKYNRTPAQISLNYLIHAHGNTVFAIPGASKMQHVEENISAMNFSLTSDEIEELSRVSMIR